MTTTDKNSLKNERLIYVSVCIAVVDWHDSTDTHIVFPIITDLISPVVSDSTSLVLLEDRTRSVCPSSTHTTDAT